MKMQLTGLAELAALYDSARLSIGLHVATCSTEAESYLVTRYRCGSDFSLLKISAERLLRMYRTYASLRACGNHSGSAIRSGRNRHNVWQRVFR